MTTAQIGDRIRDRYNTAKEQIEEVQDKVVHSLTDVREQVTDVPKELRGAWERVVKRLLSALDVPSRRDFNALARRVDALDRKLGAKRARATGKRSRN
jgi:poly(hydroxyalkanoate) granule-associated protein